MSMDFQNDGQFDEPKHPRVHKFGSLAIVLGYCTFLTFTLGIGPAIRASAIFILPLALIWKCNDLATWPTSSSTNRNSFSDDPAGIRITGWCILVLIIALRTYAAVI
jgi:hypothetical protein